LQGNGGIPNPVLTNNILYLEFQGGVELRGGEVDNQGGRSDNNDYHQRNNESSLLHGISLN
jgi:hypothetical protein